MEEQLPNHHNSDHYNNGNTAGLENLFAGTLTIQDMEGPSDVSRPEQILPQPPLFQFNRPMLLPGAKCYSDAATLPDHKQMRRAGLGVFIQDPGRQLNIYIKAAINSISTVLMAEAAAISLAGTITAALQVQEIYFLSDNQQLVKYFNGKDLSTPPQWNIKYFTQNFLNSTSAMVRKVAKILRSLNSTAHSLATQAYNLHSISASDVTTTCSNCNHNSSCPVNTALQSVQWDSFIPLAVSCC